MAKRFDVCAPRAGREEGKTFWHRVGTAFQNDKGGIGIYFDSLPIPDKDGKCSVQLFEPKEKQQGAAQAGGGQEPAPAGRRAQQNDDDIPW